MLSEEARKTQTLSFLRSIIIPNVIFWLPTFNQVLTCFKFFVTKSDYFEFLMWHTLKFLIQNHAFWGGPKMQSTSFSRSNLNQNLIIWVESFFNFRHVLKFLFQNLKLCKGLVSKFEALWNFHAYYLILVSFPYS